MGNLRTGKLPATYDGRDLRLANYIDVQAARPGVPPWFGHQQAVPEWGMLGNGPDPEIGPRFAGAENCVFAGAAHETMLWTSASGTGEAVFSTHGVLADYGAVTGYGPTDPASDRGAGVRDVLRYRRATGVIDAHGRRHRIGAYLALEPGDVDELYVAMYLFGVVGIGLRLPRTAFTQFERGAPWDGSDGAPDDGGHYVPVFARRGRQLDCVTWGRVQSMSTEFFAARCDEAYALLSPETVDGIGPEPAGFDFAALRADLASL